ncbi:hypothetical protein GCM10009863_15550 [Streptomyces axinellae]|uniref:Chaplin domain-containing protein n=1 Tax=Streptomyces axinellae TaxID=552788 RepID=A0ABN3PWD1_9ACTN
MRKVLSRSLLTAAATTGVLAGVAGYAQADSQADSGAVGSPGVLSGNSVQAPVHLPANACGNSVSVIGLLNPTFGNGCANHSAQRTPEHHKGGHHKGTEKPEEKTAPRPAEKPAEAPEQAPERVREQPAEKPAAQSPERPDTERAPAAQPAQERADAPVREAAPRSAEQAEEAHTADVLAETGSSGTGIAAALGVGALLGGVVLYRRSATRRS